MDMWQIWSIIAIMATAFGGLIAMTYRTMATQSREFAARQDGLRDTLTVQAQGLRETTAAQIDGLRETFTSRFDSMGQRFERVENRLDRLESKVGDVDHDVRALTARVIGGDRN